MSAQSTGPVVVGIDFTPAAEAAARYGAQQAERRQVPLVLVFGFADRLEYDTPRVAGYGRAVLKEANLRLDAIVDGLRRAHPDLAVSGSVVLGSGAKSLVSASGAASLVVVGSRGHGRVYRLFARSVSSQVAAHASCPVVVVRPVDESAPAEPAVPPAHGSVVVGVDGSETSVAAVEFAFQEASRRETELVVANVWAMAGLAGLSQGREWGQDASEWTAQMEEDADRLVAEAVAGRAESYPDVKTHRVVVHGLDPAATLLDLADQHSADTVVVGTRGSGGFTELLLGSVAQDLLASGRHTVVVIPFHPETVATEGHS